MKDMNECVVEPDMPVVSKNEVVLVGNTPTDLLAIAVNQGADIDKLSKLMDLQERWENNEAKKAYNVSMSKAKENPPEINKDAEGHNKAKHASLGNVTAKVNSWLSKFGLHASWKTSQEEKSIFVTCTITHVMGHSESTTLSAGADTSGSKNAIQALGSTVTYLQRYTIFALTGLAAVDQDDDGNAAGAPVEKITEEQALTLNALASEVNADFNGFCKYFKVEDIDDLPASQYGRAVKMLEKKREL